MPDPREVAAKDAYEKAYLAFANHPIWSANRDIYPDDSEWAERLSRTEMIRTALRAAIAADRRWLAEHAPERAKQAVETYGNAFAAYQWEITYGAWADTPDRYQEEKLELDAAETALLALIPSNSRELVIDEAAVERAYQTITSRHYSRTHDAIRAALEAFVAGGEGRCEVSEFKVPKVIEDRIQHFQNAVEDVCNYEGRGQGWQDVLMKRTGAGFALTAAINDALAPPPAAGIDRAELLARIDSLLEELPSLRGEIGKSMWATGYRRAIDDARQSIKELNALVEPFLSAEEGK